MSAIDTETLIDSSRIGRLHLQVLMLGILVLMADGFDTQAIAYVAPQLARQWHLSHEMLGTVFSVNLLGAFFGYIGVAPLAGRFGPKRVVVLSMAAVGLFTLLSALAGGLHALIVWRFLTGLGIGGSQPGAVALVGEYCPKRRRATFITLIYLGFSMGQILAGGAADLLLRQGWRPVLGAGGGLAMLLALALAAALPESLEFLANTGRQRGRAAALLQRLVPGAVLPEPQRRRSISVLALFGSGRSLGTLLLWVAMILNLAVNYFAQFWLTKLLVQLGELQGAAILVSTFISWGGIPPGFVIGPLIDRFGGYRVMIALFLALGASCAATGLFLVRPIEMVPVMAGAAAIGFCLSSGQKGLGALAVDFYPTALRSAGLGWMFGVARSGAILGSFMAGPLLQLGWRPSGLFYLAGLVPLGAAGALLAMARAYPGSRSRDPMDAPLRAH